MIQKGAWKDNRQDALEIRETAALHGADPRGRGKEGLGGLGASGHRAG